MRHGLFLVCALCVLLGLARTATAQDLPYAIVDTGQSDCYDDSRKISCPKPGQGFYGQDGDYLGNRAAYKDNGDGTVSDLVTGLTWVKARGERKTWAEHMQDAKNCRVGGHDDWRAPTIKELYSLIDFNGRQGRDAASSTPYIDTRFFDFEYGDPSRGVRIIDCQDYSATRYTGLTMHRNATVFGVNFADGRIKGYPENDRSGLGRYMRYVRGNPAYGTNAFADNGDGTVTDRATSLVWQRADAGKALNWKDALAYCQDLSLAGHDDWRLPNAKELQSIVDYSRSPEATNSAAIDPVFSVSDTESYYWTATTLLEGRQPGEQAVYVAFGRAMGYFGRPGQGGPKPLIDVHGAGAQRSDPKSGDPAAFPQGRGPQGDDVRIHNQVRCVRGGQVTPLFQ